MSRVDVIVPCYRYAHYLRGCVESVLSQSVTDVRVLIIDDASPDHTADVAEDLVARDSRVHLIRHAVNRGHIATYNEGLDWVGGDYTILLSADDLLAPGSLSRAVRLMDAHPKVGLAYGKGILFRSEPPSWTRPIPDECRWEILEGADFLESCFADGVNPICTPTAVTRTWLQKKLGGYRKELPHAGDMEMWMRFAAHSQVGNLDEIQAYYRQHDTNMSHDWFSAPLADWRQRKAAFDTLFREQGESMPDPDSLRRKADRGLSWSAFWAASKAFEAGNPERCQEILDFALGLNPGLRDRPEYARLRWKRRAGRRVWSVLRPMVELVRVRPARPLSHRA
jgi:glycosyltransferase involved in cell wall biosynthesis